MARQLRQTGQANRDFEDILDYTAVTYDEDQARAYAMLLGQALRDIEEDPEHPSSLPRPKLGSQVRSYHIELSKKRSGSGVKSPRHVIFYTLKYPGVVKVLRILHDRADPKRHLPKE